MELKLIQHNAVFSGNDKLLLFKKYIIDHFITLLNNSYIIRTVNNFIDCDNFRFCN